MGTAAWVVARLITLLAGSLGTTLAEHGTTVAAATLPAGSGAGGTQLGVVAELVGGQRAAGSGLEADGIQLRASIVEQGGQVGTAGIGLVAEPREGTRAVVELGGAIAAGIIAIVGAGGLVIEICGTDRQ